MVGEDGKTGCKFVSENFTNITGLNPELVLDNGIHEVIHADDLEEAEKALEKAFSGKPSSISCKYKTADDNYISVIQSFKPDFNADGDRVESVKSVAMIELEVEN